MEPMEPMEPMESNAWERRIGSLRPNSELRTPNSELRTVGPNRPSRV